MSAARRRSTFPGARAIAPLVLCALLSSVRGQESRAPTPATHELALPEALAQGGATLMGGPVVDLGVMEASDFTPQTYEAPSEGRSRLSLPASTNSFPDTPVSSPAPPGVDLLSIESMRAFLQDHPDHPGILAAYGRLLFYQGDLSNSVAALERAYTLDPTPWAVNNYAAVIAVRGEHDKAAALLRELLLKHPTYSRARFNLACVYRFLGRHDEAMQQLLMIEKMAWDPLLTQLADPDLDPLRTRPDFIDLQQRLEKIGR